MRDAFELHRSSHLRPLTPNFIAKEMLAQVFSCKFCEIFKNNYFEEHLQTTVSGCRMENHAEIVEIEPQRFTAFNLSCLHQQICSYFFFLLLFTIFLSIFVLVLTKLNLQRENYMENLSRF